MKGYSYRDLKIENLLYFSDEKIKLCDFGSISNKSIVFAKMNSEEKQEEIDEYEKTTTLMYRPPEMCDPTLNYVINE